MGRESHIAVGSQPIPHLSHSSKCVPDFFFLPAVLLALPQIVQTPAVVLIEMYFYSKRISGQALTSIGVLLVGVVLASIYDPQVGRYPQGGGGS
jgi:hypothetical protein